MDRVHVETLRPYPEQHLVKCLACKKVQVNVKDQYDPRVEWATPCKRCGSLYGRYEDGHIR